MKMFKLNNKNKGFTILELIITIFVVTIGISGVYIITSQIISYTTLSGLRLTASYLGQEGIEIVKNIRDTNCLEDVDWDTDLGVGDWEADYTSQSLTDPYSTSDFLKINVDGFYNYTSGTNTKFQREITIFDKTDLSSPPDVTIDMFKVSVIITWKEKGKDYSITVQENLYDLYSSYCSSP